LGVRPPLVSLFLSGISVCRSFFKARSSEYQRHALKAFGTSVGDEEGHEADCILAREGEQAEKTVKFTPPLHHWKTYCPSCFRALT